MQDHYRTLGLNHSATADEIRRAYRILARRYHPDLNPGQKSEDRFKLISQAYETLSDPQKRAKFDLELESAERSGGPSLGSVAERAYRRAQSAAAHRAAAKANQEAARQRTTTTQKPATTPKQSSSPSLLKAAWQQLSKLRSEKTSRGAARLAVVEVSLSLREALFGGRKSIEISEPEGLRKVSVRVPPGSRAGSVVHLRSTTASREELVVIFRVASHPFLSMHAKGVVIEVPITVPEAIEGASIMVPTLEDQIVLKIPAGSQSGSELRVKERGVTNRDGQRGDLFYRLLIKLPENSAGLAVAGKPFAALYTPGNIRAHLPPSLNAIE